MVTDTHTHRRTTVTTQDNYCHSRCACVLRINKVKGRCSIIIVCVNILADFSSLFTVRPEFTDTFAVKQSRHPILDKISLQSPVPNNIVSMQFVHDSITSNLK